MMKISSPPGGVAVCCSTLKLLMVLFFFWSIQHRFEGGDFGAAPIEPNLSKRKVFFWNFLTYSEERY